MFIRQIEFSCLAERSFRLRSRAGTLSSAAVAGFTLSAPVLYTGGSPDWFLYSRIQISCFGTTTFFLLLELWNIVQNYVLALELFLKTNANEHKWKKVFWIQDMSVGMALVLQGVLLINVKRKGGSKREWSFPQRVWILNGTELVWAVKSEAVFTIETSDRMFLQLWLGFVGGCSKSCQMGLLGYNGDTLI